MNIITDNKVTERHKIIVEKILKEQIGKMHELSDNWFIEMSDSSKDRVYLYDKNKNEEYSIAFADNKHGFNFYVYKRTQITDKQYNMIISERPEFKKVNREDLAQVVQIDNGYVELFIPKNENIFKKFIEEENLKDFDISSDCTTLIVSNIIGIHNYIIQTMPIAKKVVVIRNSSTKKIGQYLSELSTVAKAMNYEKYIPIKIVIEQCEAFVDDAIDYFTECGYNVEVEMDITDIKENK